jgi:SpoVK/Ycf46/Vps4 family AAA+-type ATPase
LSLRSSTLTVHRTSKTKRDLDVLAPSDVKLADVAGMEDVKARLEVSLLGPIRNPELMRAYKISARGGLLLYGPPGCGKTFLAKAVSGELDANFYPIGISDVLQQYLGNSERAVHEIFEVARRNAPCVLFFDELDALGMRRANMRGDSGHRTVVNALLAETDPATADNTGVYVIGATNAPWDVDPALRRPGRFDRVIFVGLPDSDARAEIVRIHLRDRPVAGIDLKSIAVRTDGFLRGRPCSHLRHRNTVGDGGLRARRSGPSDFDERHQRGDGSGAAQRQSVVRPRPQRGRVRQR